MRTVRSKTSKGAGSLFGASFLVLAIALGHLVFSAQQASAAGSACTTEFPGFSSGLQTLNGGAYDATSNPYAISTEEHLVYLSWAVSSANPDATLKSAVRSSSYLQTTSLDLEGCQWTPIGPNATNAFAGTYDGGGFLINNLKVRSSASYAGLIGWNSGTVRKLGLRNVDVVGTYQVGAIAGYSRDGTGKIEFVSATGSVSGQGDVGGLVGLNYRPVENSYSNVQLTTYSQWTPTNVGGLVGFNGAPNNSLKNSYAIGDLSQAVALRDSKGGVVGQSRSSSLNAFWDTESSGTSSSGITNDSGALAVPPYAGTGKSTAEMKSLSTFTDTASSAGLVSSWDIVQGWTAFNSSSSPARVWGICETINDGYPFLLWEYTSDPCSPSSGNVSASTRASENTSNPGIFLTVTARNGDRIATTRIVFGAYSVGKNSPYLVTLQQTNSNLGQRILAQGSMNPGGHLEREIALPALAPGSHKLVFTSRGARGALLTLTNVITVDSQGKVTSVTPEALQPFAR